MPPIVLLDANVLFPFILRDTLLRVAASGCYRVHWSQRILDEVTRNLIDQHRVSKDGAERLTGQMNRAFPEALVKDWEAKEAKMKNDPKDRHVAAAADHIDASLIITFNLRDFKNLPSGLVAIEPDNFLLDRLSTMPDEVVTALAKQVAAYQRPPSSVPELLESLARIIPRFASAAEMLVKESSK